jgi:hypothetical protein
LPGLTASLSSSNRVDDSVFPEYWQAINLEYLSTYTSYSKFFKKISDLAHHQKFFADSNTETFGKQTFGSI